MRRILTILATSLACALTGQVHPYFNVQYGDSMAGESTYSILETDTGYVACGGSTVAWTQQNIDFIVLDSFGQPVNIKSYGKPNTLFYPGSSGSLIKTSDGGFALAGNIVDTIQVVALLMKFDSDGDTMWTRTFGGDSIYAFYQCKQLHDGGYILCGFTDEYDYYGDFLLVRVDSLGNELWRRTYGGANEEYAYSVIETLDGGFLLGGYTRSFGGDVDQYIVKTDSLGAFQWYRFFGSTYDDGFASVLQTSDGNYLASGVWTYGGPNGNPLSKPFLVKVDSLGFTIWSNDYGQIEPWTGVNTVAELPNGNLVAGGTCMAGPRAAGLVFVTDSDGDSLWYRHFYCGSNDISVVYDVKATTDNGFVATGYGMDINVQNYWWMKLDSLGCDTVGCNLLAIDELNETNNEVLIFPNPSSSTLNLDFGGSHDLYSISINDMSGRIMILLSSIADSLVSIDVSGLAFGTYIVSVSDSHGNAVVRKLFVVQ